MANEYCNFTNINSTIELLNRIKSRLESLDYVDDSGWIVNCYIGYSSELGGLTLGYSSSDTFKLFNVTEADILILNNNKSSNLIILRNLIRDLDLSYGVVNITNMPYRDAIATRDSLVMLFNIDKVDYGKIYHTILYLSEYSVLSSSVIGSITILLNYSTEKIIPRGTTDVDMIISGTVKSLEDADNAIINVVNSEIGNYSLGDTVGIDNKGQEVYMEDMARTELNSIYRILNRLSIYLGPLFIMLTLPVLYLAYISIRQYSIFFEATFKKVMMMRGIWSARYGSLFTYYLILIIAAITFLSGYAIYSIEAGLFALTIGVITLWAGMIGGNRSTEIGLKGIAVFYSAFLIFYIITVRLRDLIDIIGVNPLLSLVYPLLYWLKPFYTISILLVSIKLLKIYIHYFSYDKNTRISRIREALFLRIISNYDYIIVGFIFSLSIALLGFLYPKYLIDGTVYTYTPLLGITVEALVTVSEEVILSTSKIYLAVTLLLALAFTIRIQQNIRVIRVFNELRGVKDRFPTISGMLIASLGTFIIFLFSYLSLAMYLQAYIYSIVR
ncbi:MAG: hypothetical protein F7C36_01485 [Desulfurococcales archaeon]|nr:hypothetical protein [Desulfurococcales archaeon]